MVRLELDGSAVDIANPTFDPFAIANPVAAVSEGMREALDRVHRPYDETAADLRASRIAEAEARMAEVVEQEKRAEWAKVLQKKTIWDRMKGEEYATET